MLKRAAVICRQANKISEKKFQQVAMRTVFLKAAASLLAVVMLVGCSAEKFVPDNSYLLDKVELRSDAKDFRAADLMPYIRQQGNSKWFSLFKIPLSTYSLSGRDTTKWINRTLQKIGEEPVLFDTLQARLSLLQVTE